MMRHLAKAALLALAATTTAAALAAPAAASCIAPWPAWQQFKTTFMRPDGRIEDADTPRQQTVSEAQAYALFFALVADDRAAFERILSWTENNLAQGDLSAHLPAWWWGRRDDGSWGVLDSNAASDADLWMAYTLGEAGRLWHERRYSALSRLLARRILAEETATLPTLGLTLLPGPTGFHPTDHSWRLNPSYAPVQLLRRLAANDSAQAAQWQALAASAVQLIERSAPRGLAPDWALFDARQGMLADAQTQAVGSYDAIRVYLWIGLLAPEDSAAPALRAAVQPFAEYVTTHGAPPEKIDSATGAVVAANGPAGFSAAVAPLLERFDARAAQQQWQRSEGESLAATAYYNRALMAFAQGFRDAHFRFSGDGSLLRKETACATR